jgi:ADP-ribosylation factor-like protein 2
VRCDVQEAGWQANNAVQGLGLDAIKTHKWTIMACSAMTGTNLQAGLQWVVQDAKSRLFLY